jgi:hypothetical protein
MGAAAAAAVGANHETSVDARCAVTARVTARHASAEAKD